MIAVRCKGSDGEWLYGTILSLNIHSISEVNVGFSDEADSVDMRDLEVRLKDNTWKDMRKALDDKDILCNNHNTDVDFPHSEQELKQGYNFF